MEMVDMDITRFWLSGPNSRSVNILCSASKSWMNFDVRFFDFDNMTFLDLFDMHLMFFDINSQYVVRFSQYLVKINQYSSKCCYYIIRVDCDWR